MYQRISLSIVISFKNFFLIVSLKVGGPQFYLAFWSPLLLKDVLSQLNIGKLRMHLVLYFIKCWSSWSASRSGPDMITVEGFLTFGVHQCKERTIRKVMGGGEFSSRRNFFSLSNSLYDFFLGHSMNIF